MYKHIWPNTRPRQSAPILSMYKLIFPHIRARQSTPILSMFKHTQCLVSLPLYYIHKTQTVRPYTIYTKPRQYAPILSMYKHISPNTKPRQSAPILSMYKHIWTNTRSRQSAHILYCPCINISHQTQGLVSLPIYYIHKTQTVCPYTIYTKPRQYAPILSMYKHISPNTKPRHILSMYKHISPNTRSRQSAHILSMNKISHHTQGPDSLPLYYPCINIHKAQTVVCPYTIYTRCKQFALILYIQGPDSLPLYYIHKAQRVCLYTIHV